LSFEENNWRKLEKDCNIVMNPFAENIFSHLLKHPKPSFLIFYYNINCFLSFPFYLRLLSEIFHFKISIFETVSGLSSYAN